ncbi:MAG: oxidoreductase [Myxococcaceae bacterium]
MDVVVRQRPKLYKLDLAIERVIRESVDTVTLVFEKAPEELVYKAGQFCNIDVHQFDTLKNFTAYLEAQKGRKELPRSYSLASAPHEPQLAITIKEELFIPGETKYPPLISSHLVRTVRAGDRITLVGFQGPYVLPDDVEQHTQHLVHVVAGSGAVPNFSILKDALHRGLKLRHTFIYSNRTWADVAYLEALGELEAKYPSQLRVVHTLTRETDESKFNAKVRRGRVSLELLRELVPDADKALAYVCGPAVSSWERRASLESGTPTTPRFLENAIAHLHELGIPDKRIKREAYG